MAVCAQAGCIHALVQWGFLSCMNDSPSGEKLSRAAEFQHDSHKQHAIEKEAEVSEKRRQKLGEGGTRERRK